MEFKRSFNLEALMRDMRRNQKAPQSEKIREFVKRVSSPEKQDRTRIAKEKSARGKSAKYMLGKQ